MAHPGSNATSERIARPLSGRAPRFYPLRPHRVNLGPRRHLSTVWAALELRGSIIAARPASLLLAAGIPVGGATAADQLVLPEVVTRTRPLEAAYRFDKSANGRGFLDIEWSDVDGRAVERRRIPLDLAGSSELALPLDIRRRDHEKPTSHPPLARGIQVVHRMKTPDEWDRMLTAIARGSAEGRRTRWIRCCNRRAAANQPGYRFQQRVAEYGRFWRSRDGYE